MNLAVILVSAQYMERDIVFFANYPAVVGSGRNIEARTGSQLTGGPIFHEDGHASAKHNAKMLDSTVFADPDPDMVGPLPSGFIGSSADGHIGHIDKLETTLFEVLDFVGIIKELYQDLMIHLTTTF